MNELKPMSPTNAGDERDPFRYSAGTPEPDGRARALAFLIVTLSMVGVLYGMIWLSQKLFNTERHEQTPAAVSVTHITSKNYHIRPVIDDCDEEGCRGISMYTAYGFTLDNGKECILRSKEAAAERLWREAEVGDEFDCEKYDLQEKTQLQ